MTSAFMDPKKPFSPRLLMTFMCLNKHSILVYLDLFPASSMAHFSFPNTLHLLASETLYLLGSLQMLECHRLWIALFSSFSLCTPDSFYSFHDFKCYLFVSNGQIYASCSHPSWAIRLCVNSCLILVLEILVAFKLKLFKAEFLNFLLPKRVSFLFQQMASPSIWFLKLESGNHSWVLSPSKTHIYSVNKSCKFYLQNASQLYPLPISTPNILTLASVISQLETESLPLLNNLLPSLSTQRSEYHFL